MKTISVYRPTAPNALSDFDRYFESFFGDSFLTPAGKLLNRMNAGMSSGIPAVDIREIENAYVLDMELPGYDEKSINVHIDGSNLTIASSQEEGKADETGVYIVRERQINSFSRSFKLPDNADAEAVSASFKNGILTLQIKKRAEAQKRAIQINKG